MDGCNSARTSGNCVPISMTLTQENVYGVILERKSGKIQVPRRAGLIKYLRNEWGWGKNEFKFLETETY